MESIQLKDFIIAFAPIALSVSALLIILFQITLPKFRLSLSYGSTLITLLIVALFIAMTFLAMSGTKDGPSDSSFLPRFISQIFYNNVSAFKSQFIWNRHTAIYSLAIVIFLMLIVTMMRDILTHMKLHLVEAYQMALFSGAGLIFFICSQNLIMMFISVELASLPLYVLAAWDRNEKSCSEAGLKYFLLSVFSSTFFLLGTAFIYGSMRTVNIVRIGEILSNTSISYNSDLLLIGAILVIMSLFFKVALFPLHGWVADVYEGSITIVTALMASLIKIASVGVVFHILSYLGIIFQDTLQKIILLLAIGSMLYGNIVALVQKNLKRIFAYSSIAHAGYMAAMFALSFSKETRADAFASLFYYVFAYALGTVFIFGLIAFMETRESTKKMIMLDDLKNLSEKNPYIAFALSAASLSLAGIPPLAGFYGKFFILKSLLKSEMYIVAIFVSISALIGIYYYARIFFYSYWYSSATDQDASLKSSLKSKEIRPLFSGFWPKISGSILTILILTSGILSPFLVYQIWKFYSHLP